MKISFAKFCEHLINQKLNELKNIFDDDIVFLLNYQNNKDYDEYIPFNWFFLDYIHDIINLYKKISDFNLSDSLIDY